MIRNEINNSAIKKTSRYFKAKIVENISLSKYFKILTIIPVQTFSENLLLNPLPGQFYMLQGGSTYDPLLKRPFSIFGYEDNTLQFLYRIRGKGTHAIAGLKRGDVINLIGPLGNSYPEPRGDFIAVAGGIGIASLLPFLEQFKNRAYLFYGARNKDELIMTDKARALSKEMFITTDDGSEGQKGLVTDLLRKFLNTTLNTQHFTLIYACGPAPMMKTLAQIIEGRGIKCYVSLEEHMACGVGACLGCVTKIRSQNTEAKIQTWTYKRVCKEGPVFDIEDIVWE